MIEIKDGLNIDVKRSFYIFCIEGYKFFSFSSAGKSGVPRYASQFFINVDGRSVPAKCDK